MRGSVFEKCPKEFTQQQYWCNMESIKSDANVANVQCFYPLEANIETTGQCCILLGSEFYFKSNYYSGWIGIVSTRVTKFCRLCLFVKHPVWLRSQINCSTVFILDELSSKYFQSVAEDKNVCGAYWRFSSNWLPWFFFVELLLEICSLAGGKGEMRGGH